MYFYVAKQTRPTFCLSVLCSHYQGNVLSKCTALSVRSERYFEGGITEAALQRTDNMSWAYIPEVELPHIHIGVSIDGFPPSESSSP